MSGMSSILHILLYREASSHHQPNEKGGTAARDATIPKSCSPFNHLVARGVVGGMEGCPVCCSFRSCGRPLRSGCQHRSGCQNRSPMSRLSILRVLSPILRDLGKRSFESIGEEDR